jgi:hypothetical protein
MEGSPDCVALDSCSDTSRNNRFDHVDQVCAHEPSNNDRDFTLSNSTSKQLTGSTLFERRQKKGRIDPIRLDCIRPFTSKSDTICVLSAPATHIRLQTVPCGEGFVVHRCIDIRTHEFFLHPERADGKLTSLSVPSSASTDDVCSSASTNSVSSAERAGTTNTAEQISAAPETLEKSPTRQASMIAAAHDGSEKLIPNLSNCLLPSIQPGAESLEVNHIVSPEARDFSSSSNSSKSSNSSSDDYRSGGSRASGGSSSSSCGGRGRGSGSGSGTGHSKRKLGEGSTPGTPCNVEAFTWLVGAAAAAAAAISSAPAATLGSPVEPSAAADSEAGRPALVLALQPPELPAAAADGLGGSGGSGESAAEEAARRKRARRA